MFYVEFFSGTTSKSSSLTFYKSGFSINPNTMILEFGGVYSTQVGGILQFNNIRVFNGNSVVVPSSHFVSGSNDLLYD
jgi:hypothetical protein